jgi:hypothetical protein
LFVFTEIDGDKQEEKKEKKKKVTFCSKITLPASYDSRGMKYPEGRIP